MNSKIFIQLKYSMLLLCLLFVIQPKCAAQTTVNKMFSFGSYGRVGIGYSPAIQGNTSRQLNLLGQGSIGGRLEEQDYVELLAALHFKPANIHNDTTVINVQARGAFYNAGAQFIGNTSSKSINGLTISMPELYVEANHIMGSKWSAWVGAKFFRGNDIHIADHFYFDDHSSQGFGLTWNHSTFAMVFPSSVDTNASYPPYFYLNIVNGTPTLALRQRTVAIGEQEFILQNGGVIKLLGEYHRLADATATESSDSTLNYPPDGGWVLGIKYNNSFKTRKEGSFNQLALRYGHGIANGGDGGGSKTWLTYGAPDLSTQKFNTAYSWALTEHFLLNLSDRFSLNGYALYIHSKGAAESTNKAPDYFDRPVFNRKTDFATGFRSFIYITNWFHLLNEASFALRKDGDQPSAQMFKLAVVPTFVPTAKRDPWARPHIRLVFSAARYNQFAQDNLYSPYLQQTGTRTWGIYFGVKSEWWLY